MIAILQRCSSAKVEIDGETVGQCGKGLMILLGAAKGDETTDAELLAAKIADLRIFDDPDGKMNLSIRDIGGEALVISNFTLLANYKKGNRPDYFGAEKPQKASELYEYFIACLRDKLGHVESGRFGADMQVTLTNDGPVTISMDSSVLKK